ncbi:polysaccharide biosynthesis tyrosine autokinase [Clostridium grantii]|uniref:non-specific protein-tyrosine kinase n=1 Tax=Clostridium grantii DSM 8605 TaxID=1121316 RepID=A0A1M5UYN6_9CLOT|nr:polysaccharide biosynthesis tyrosine autokinase [Clostridium grantii]SHH68115.1 capsular exopolysaccharide family [Clostridium grantii DSM 8605]
MQKDDRLDLRDYLHIIKKKIMVIITITFLTTLIGGIYSFYVLKPTYYSSMSVIIGKTVSVDGNISMDINDVTMYVKALETYIQIAKSEDVAEGARGILGDRYSSGQLMGMLSVGAQSNTQIMNITVQAGNEEEAKEIVLAITQSFKENAEKLIPNGNIKIFQNPRSFQDSVNKIKIILYSFILGLLISITLVFLLDFLDNTIKTKEEVEKFIGLPVIGLIPKITEKVYLIVKSNPSSIAAEGFRTLRTNIQYSSIDKKIRTIVVTSAGQGEGKTQVSGNLALTMANLEKKTIIIDCDMRRPNVHRKFRISNEIGLSDILSEQAEFEEVVHSYDKHLCVIPSGPMPPNPAEMLNSIKMKFFIEKLKNDFDYIILDTPPVIPVTDAQVIANEADGVILVVASNEADKDAVVRAKELLLKVRANILGVVLNKIEFSKGKGYWYNYEYYYSYGSSNKHKNTKSKRLKQKSI